jgi:hypothetical protein
MCVAFLSKKDFFFVVIRHVDDLPRRLLDDAREADEEDDSREDDDEEEGEGEDSRDWRRRWVDVIRYIRGGGGGVVVGVLPNTMYIMYTRYIYYARELRNAFLVCFRRKASLIRLRCWVAYICCSLVVRL